MTVAILYEYQATTPFGDFEWRWYAVRLVGESTAHWRVWSWRYPFTKVIAKAANCYRLKVGDAIPSNPSNS